MSKARPVVVILLAGLLLPGPASAQVPVPMQVSSDPYTNPQSQHQTQVEPDTFSFGNSVLAAFMTGRQDGGSANIGWAFSSDAGTTWASGFLPALTVNSEPPGTNGRAADPSVAYDAAHGVWLINMLAATDGRSGTGLFVSRSPEGVTWESPTVVAGYGGGAGNDKNWMACDNGASSPFFGSCYVAWTNLEAGGLLEVARSTDGGLTWSEPVRPSGQPTGLGVQPVVQANGNVVIVALDRLEQSILSVRSTDGGASFGGPTYFSEVRIRRPVEYRNNPFPSVEVDGAGRIYAVWQDCSFRNNCLNSGNDTVISTSDDGVGWSPVRPIRPAPRSGPNQVPAGADYLQPGVGVDRATGGSSARLGLYFIYMDSPCRIFEDCSVNVGFTSSADGGQTWQPAVRVNGESMRLSWLPRTGGGRMTGDYISTSVVAGKAVSAFPLAQGPAPDGSFRQAMHAASMEVPAGPPVDPPGSPSDPGGLLGLLADLLSLVLQLLPGI